MEWNISYNMYNTHRPGGETGEIFILSEYAHITVCLH